MNRRELSDQLSEDTQFVIAGSEKPKRSLSDTPRARRPALQRADMEKGVK